MLQAKLPPSSLTGPTGAGAFSSRTARPIDVWPDLGPESLNCRDHSEVDGAGSVRGFPRVCCAAAKAFLAPRSTPPRQTAQRSASPLTCRTTPAPGATAPIQPGTERCCRIVASMLSTLKTLSSRE